MSRTHLTQSDVLTILEGLYQSPFENDWSSFLEGIRSTLDLVFPTMLEVEKDTNHITLRGAGFPQEGLEIYEEYYGHMDPLVPFAEGIPTGTVFTTEGNAGIPWRGTEYYEDFLTPCDVAHATSVVIVDDDKRLFGLTLNRSFNRDDGINRVEKELLSILIPHLRCAHKLGEIVAKVESQRQATLEALDRFDFGVVAIGRSGEVLMVNRVARQIAAECDGLEIAKRGLIAARASDTQALHKSVHEAISTTLGHSASSGDVQRLGRPSGKSPYELLVTPVAVERLAVGSDPVCAIVFFTDPERTPRTVDRHLKTLHGLTQAEARVASRLVAGATAREIADEKEISVHTVRDQIKSLLSKTDTRRQSELVRLLVGSVASLADPSRSE